MAPVERSLPAVCECCGSDKMTCNGTRRARQKYMCAVCKRQQGGYPIVAVPPKPEVYLFPCPECGGASRLTHRLERHSKLRCTVCGRNFTDFYIISPPPPRREGPFKHRKTFCLSIGATTALVELNAKGMSDVQAIRWLLRGELDRPLVTLTVARRVRDPLTGDRETVIWRAPQPPAPLPSGVLPNMHAASYAKLRARLDALTAAGAGGPGTKRGFKPTVAVQYKVSVPMDDRSKSGLLRAMERYGADHQEAVRRLLIDGRVNGWWVEKPAPAAQRLSPSEGRGGGRRRGRPRGAEEDFGF